MNVLQTISLTYLLTVNIFGAAIAGADKQKAKRKAWRTPEKRYLLIALIGGGPGVLIGFALFRHKTRHGGLIARVIALTALCYGAVTAVLFLLS